MSLSPILSVLVRILKVSNLSVLKEEELSRDFTLFAMYATFWLTLYLRTVQLVHTCSAYNFGFTQAENIEHPKP